MSDSPLFLLPNEVLTQVASLLILPELQHVANTCSLLRAICYPRLQKHLALKRRYHSLASNETDQFGWLHPLTRILRGELPPAYVEHVAISRCEYYYSKLSKKGADAKEALPAQRDLDLVVQAAKDSPWITDHDACGTPANAKNMPEFVQELVEGDQDDILACLVPLLPNLRSIAFTHNVHYDDPDDDVVDDSTIDVASLPLVLSRIAVQAFANPHLNLLGNLREIRGHSFTTAILHDWLPHLLCLPSLRVLDVHFEYSMTGYVHWRDDLPKSNVDELTLRGVRCDRVLLQNLAKLVNGPCHARVRPAIEWAFPCNWCSCVLRDGVVTSVQGIANRKLCADFIPRNFTGLTGQLQPL